MNHAKLLAVGLSLFFSLASRGDAPLTREEFCTKLLTEKKSMPEGTFGDQLRAFYEVYTLLTKPAKFSIPEIQKIKMPEGMWIKSELKSPRAYRNVIFALGPPPAAKPDREKWVRLQKRLTEESETVRDLSEEENVASCVAHAREKSFNPEAHLKLRTEIASLRAEKQDYEFEGLKKVLAPSLKKTEMDWEIVQATDLDDLHDQLKNPELANVLIIQHATEAGGLVDSTLRIFPKGSFSEVSPSLLSLSIYACHGERIVKNYELGKRLTESPSIYPTRYFFSVTSTQLMGSTEYAPLVGAGAFLQKIDHFLHAKMRGLKSIPAEIQTKLLPKPPAPRCSIEVAGPDVKAGTLGVILNLRHYLGSFRPGNGAQTKKFEFPCSFFDGNPLQVLILRDLQLEGNTDADVRAGFRVTVEGERASTLEVKSTDHYLSQIPDQDAPGADGANVNPARRYLSSKIVWKNR